MITKEAGGAWMTAEQRRRWAIGQPITDQDREYAVELLEDYRSEETGEQASKVVEQWVRKIRVEGALTVLAALPPLSPTSADAGGWRPIESAPNLQTAAQNARRVIEAFVMLHGPSTRRRAMKALNDLDAALPPPPTDGQQP